MKWVLLPGLDGTGKLFKPLIKNLPKSIDIEIIDYPSDIELSYQELIVFVKQKLPKEEFILLAESFSGPIAYQIALSKISNLKALILVATFLENPRPILLKLIPFNKLLSLQIPDILSRVFFLGFKVENEIIKLFNKTIKTVSPNVLKYRLKEISNLKSYSKRIKIKTIYIQATKDKLVPSKCLKSWQKICDDIDVIKIEGDHLILQPNPIHCLKVLIKVLKQL